MIRLPSDPFFKHAAHLPVPEIAARCGVAQCTVRNWATRPFTIRGVEDVYRIDRYAVAVGAHPQWIWPEWYHVTGVVTSKPSRKRTRRKVAA